MPARALLQTGRLAEEARSALDSLSKAILGVKPEDLRGPSIASGHAGFTLAHAYLAPFFPKRKHGEGMQVMINAAMESIASRPSSPSLLSGFVGLAWVVQHLQGDEIVPEDEDPNTSIDAELGQWLDHSPWKQPFDLIEGLVGLGIYGMERLPHESGRRILEKVVDRFEDSASKEKKGIAWATDTSWIPEVYRGDRPPRYFDLGLAHGQAGVLAILAAAAAAGVAKKKAEKLLDGAIDWFVAQRLPENPQSRFPTWVLPDKTPDVARDAWCYGDPGIAVALLSGAQALKHKKLEALALDVAHHAVKRDKSDTMTIDSGLCHGSFGNAQIFLRLHRMTGDKAFGDRARFFIERGLGQRNAHKTRESKGFAGFHAYDVGQDLKPQWQSDPGFLTGGAGIALVLAAALSPSDEDPGWDRVLLDSVAPRTLA